MDTGKTQNRSKVLESIASFFLLISRKKDIHVISIAELVSQHICRLPFSGFKQLLREGGIYAKHMIILHG